MAKKSTTRKTKRSALSKSVSKRRKPAKALTKASKKASRKASVIPRRDKKLHDRRFPNEKPAYRTARNALLHAEIELRRQIERVASARRKLPLGGAVSQDYEFEEMGINDTAPRRVRLSQLFGAQPTLVVYSYMYSPTMAQPCPSCTSILDSLDGAAPHIIQRVNLVVIAKSPIERIRAWAKARGWSHLRLLSSAGNTYNRDYGAEGPDGSQWPALNVFSQEKGQTYHRYCTELLFAPSDKDQNKRHVDMIWPLWNLFDFTPDGRGTTWYPKLNYTE